MGINNFWLWRIGIFMINNSSKKKAVTIILMIVAFFLIGCETDSHDNFNLRPIDDDMLAHMAEIEADGTEFAIGGIHGVSALKNEINPYEDFYGVIELEKATDYLVTNIGNASTHDLDYLFKIFLNYEAIPFRVSGEDRYEKYFTFSLERGYQIDIPFTLDFAFPNEDSTQKLTVVFIVDPFQEIINEDNHYLFWGRNAFALNNDLIIGSGNSMQFDVPVNSEIISREEDTQFVDLFIAPSFELNEWGFLDVPEFKIQVQRNEEIELLFYASPFAPSGYELENYLIIGLLNWQQVELSGNPFLFINAKENELENILDHGILTLDAIDEVGMYDFIAILIPNPSMPNSINNSFPLSVSNRFVIEVIE